MNCGPGAAGAGTETETVGCVNQVVEVVTLGMPGVPARAALGGAARRAPTKRITAMVRMTDTPGSGLSVASH